MKQQAHSYDLIDLHNHILPAVDDGARTSEETLRHLRAFHREGMTRMAVSPHLDGRFALEPGRVEQRLKRLRAVFDEVVASCAGHDDVPDLHFGQEILTPDANVARAVFRHPGVGLEGTRYALIEFGFRPNGDPVEVITEVLEAGRTPIVAHPERYIFGSEPATLAELRRWKSAGALLQLNGSSPLGLHGPVVQALSWSVLAEGLADVIGTDHHADYRSVSPAAIVRALEERGAHAQIRRLFVDNPRRILDDLPPRAAQPWEEQAVA